MRTSFVSIALAALALPGPALAYPNSFERYTYESYGLAARHYPREARFVPQQVYVPQPVYGQQPFYGAQPVYAPQPVYATHARFTPPSVSGYGSGYPVAAYPASQPVQARSCSLLAPIVGAALGGTMGGTLAKGSRNRLWAVPMGAAVGGILGGTLSGC